MEKRYWQKFPSKRFPNEVLLVSQNVKICIIFLGIYWVALVLNKSSTVLGINLFLTLYMNAAMSCRRALCSVLSLVLSSNSP